MAKIALVTDSVSYLPREAIEKYNVHIVPLSVIFGDEVYKEGIDLDASAFYEKVRTAEVLPTTSQPAIGEFISLYEKLADEGYEDAIVITISASLSGTHQTAATASQAVEGIRIHLFDSQIAALPEGYYVLEAGRLIEEGRTVDEIVRHLEAMRERGVKAYFMVDDLNHLHRGGRLTGAQALIGSLLKMKPILTFKDTKLVPFEKVRTKRRALERIKELFEADAATGQPIRASVITANRREEAEPLAEEIRQKYPNVEVDTSDIGPVVGTHVGEGTMAITWYVKGSAV